MDKQSVQNSLDHAESYCKQHGVKLTNKRRQILLGLLQSAKAMSAYELADYCKSEFGESMPPMSVYRILGFLQDKSLVHKLNSANKYVSCSHITCDHGHDVTQFLICGKCQNVKEIHVDQSTIEGLQRNVQAAGFHLINPQLEMNCLCDSCMSQGI